MESKLHIQQRAKRNQAGLMPHSFKKVGIAVMLLAVIPLVVMKTTGITAGQEHRELIRTITLNLFTLGLLFVAWSQDKVEDELTIALRLKSMWFAFFLGVVDVILEPVITVFLKNTTGATSAQGLVITMLLFYLIIYYLQKKGR